MRNVFELLVRLVASGGEIVGTLFQRLGSSGEIQSLLLALPMVFIFIKEIFDFRQQRAQSEQIGEIEELLQRINDQICSVAKRVSTPSEGAKQGHAQVQPPHGRSRNLRRNRCRRNKAIA